MSNKCLSLLPLHQGGDVDPLEGPVGGQEVAVVHAGGRVDDEVLVCDEARRADGRVARVYLAIVQASAVLPACSQRHI